MINLFILCIDEIPCYILRPHWKYVIGSCGPEEVQKKNEKMTPWPTVGLTLAWDFGVHLRVYTSHSFCFDWYIQVDNVQNVVWILAHRLWNAYLYWYFQENSDLEILAFNKFILGDPLYLIFAVSCLVSIDKRTTLTCKPHDGMILSLTLLLQIQVLLVPVHHIPQLLWGCSYMPDSLGGGDHLITPLSW